MPNQRVATNTVLEAVGGAAERITWTTSALKPSSGSLISSPPQVTTLLAVDYQLVTATLTASAGATTAVTWPTVSFTGLLSAASRIYSNGTNGAMPPTSLASNITTPLVTGQSTQLLLICNVQSIWSALAATTNPINLATTAHNTTNGAVLTGPWFSSGLTYTSFACTPNGVVTTPGAVSGLKLTLGISAQLFSVFTQ